MAVMRKNINRQLVVTFVASSVALCGFSFAANNKVCGPTALPVTTCDCPVALGAPVVDRCESSLPFAGSMYGEVSCMLQNASDCTLVSTGDANDCGEVVRCDCMADCNFVCFRPPMGCACTKFPLKPKCTKKWGSCSYSTPKA